MSYYKLSIMACLPLFFVPLSYAQQELKHVNGNDFIKVFEQLSGKQPGIRKGHAKGVCATGTFTPTPGARHYSTSQLFTDIAQANVRFSMAGGNPNAVETDRSPRGIGVQFTFKNGAVHNLAGLTTPVFPGKDPATFLGLLKTLVPNEQGQIDFSKVAEYRQQNPSTLGQFNWLQKNNPPASYAAATYYGIHTFFFINEQGEKQKFKWQLVPEKGEKPLTDEQLQHFPDTFLAKQLVDDLTNGVMTFSLQAVLGKQRDAETDPSVMWPAEREVIELGKLTLNNSGGERCQLTNYDPNLLSDGIIASDDAILKLRSTAYAISYAKRYSGQ
ncbi:catalase family peroxidase [Pseudoalteromonas mariniglutinosa]|uniref:catalase family peroxidase n=1 Tax=Pseudoalteromonas mariniglutinosa TaxID=206042 RepID=UPI00384FD08E